jgi:MazG family protein
MPIETKNYAALVTTVATLRAPGGCPWDREQTHASLTECLIEECAELIEAIDNLDYEHMLEELGDVLLNVVMQAEIAKESGKFDMEAVCKDINEKLIRRHPHVFEKDANSATDSTQVLKRWDEIKAKEKKNGHQIADNSPFKPLPPRLPSLLFAKKTYKHIQKAHLEDNPVLPREKICGYAGEMSESELGETLFSIAAACRIRGLDPEQLTRAYTQTVIQNLS